MGKHMTLKQFADAVGLSSCRTWDEIAAVVRSEAKDLKMARARVEQLTDDLDRIRDARRARRARWNEAATTTLKLATGALAGAAAYAAHVAGLWP